MTPAERQEWERLVGNLLDAQSAYNADEYVGCVGDEGSYEPVVANARAALTAFVERLTAGEEVLQVVNPKYPGHKHYWAANGFPAFPASYVLTPGTFRVTPLDGGTDGD